MNIKNEFTYNKGNMTLLAKLKIPFIFLYSLPQIWEFAHLNVNNFFWKHIFFQARRFPAK